MITKQQTQPTNRPRAPMIPVHVQEFPRMAYTVVVQVGEERFVAAKFDTLDSADYLKHKLLMSSTKADIIAEAA